MVLRSRPAVTAVALAALLVVCWYVAALQLGSGPHFGASADTAYNRMGDAFVHGRLDLGPAPKGLLALPDPYDPVANDRFRTAGLHDLSLYHGRLYAYWGPVPALLLYAPARLAGQVLPDGWVVLAFCLGSFAVGVGILLVALRRAAVAARAWMLFFAVLGLGTANLAAHLLSRPAQYEVAIAAATFFVLLSVLLFLLGGLDAARPRLGVLAAASTSAGLATGSRVTTGLVVLVGVALLAWRARRAHEPRAVLLRTGAAVLGPFALIVGLLLAYNAARFGTPLDFGRRWQLTVVNLSAHGVLDPSVVGPSLWNYLLPPPLLRAQFPFLFGNAGVTYPWHVPATYISGDAVIGVAFLAPLTLLLLGAPRLLRGASPGLRGRVALLAGLGVVLLIPLLVLYGAPAAVRYEADFLPAWMLAALLVWLTWSRRAAGVLGGIAIAWGVLVLGASALDNDQVLSELHPATFRSLESAFSPVSRAMASIAGHPVLAKVGDQAAGPPYRYDAIGVAGADVTVGDRPVEVRIVSPGARSARLELTLSSGATVLATLRGQTTRATGPGRRRLALALKGGVNVVELATAGRATVHATDLRLGGA